jgi:hypothetical protein
MNEVKKKMSLNGIPHSEVETMVETYHTYCKKHPDYDEHTHIKCIWFPIRQINDLCNKIETEGGDGLRIYFGRYPNDVSLFEPPLPAADTNSVILVSTGKDDSGKITPKNDYFVDEHAAPENRGEQCQPTCTGVTVNLPNL